MAATRTITSTVLKPNGAPWQAARVRFTLVDDTYLLSPGTSYPITYVDAITDSNGTFAVTLAANLVSPYRVRMPDGEEFLIYVPLDNGSNIELETLRNLYTGVPFTALPQLQGPTGPVSQVTGPTGPVGATSTVAGPTGPSGGPTGRAGPGVVMMTRTFSTTTTDTDPGNGVLKLNNVTQNAATQAFIDLLSTSAVDQTTLLDALDDSTNTIKGWVRIEKQSDATAYLLGTLTAVTSATGYRKLVFTVVSSSASNPFTNNDPIFVTFDRTGDAGTAGANGATGTAGTTGATGPAGSTTITGGIKFVIGDVAGSPIATGTKGYISIPYALTITGWRLLLDASSTTTLDVWADSYANYPPVDADRIAGTEKPSTSAAIKAEDTSLTTWTTTSITAGTVLGVEVEANNTAKWAELTIMFSRTLP